VTASQQRRVRDLFEAALDCDGAASADRFVSREAADDPIVRDEVLSLLAHHSRAGEFLARPAAEIAADLLADDALAPGTQVGSYTIIRELGRGGMGRVYLATDGRLGRTVALKALAPHLVRDPGHRERLRREARAAAALTHPGICTVYALEEIDGDLFIASEFVDGHTLRDEIASGRPPSPADVIRTARELAAALAAAHGCGIVHRDLKPDNVMRTRDGRLKILDFGLARIDRDLNGASPIVTQPGMLVGTPAYMAPEQINGTSADARSDIFAFGVLLYEYACGVHPFEGSTPLVIVARVLESDARPLANRCPDLPSSLVDVISRCLRKPPDERFASAAELVGALKATDAVRDRPRHATWWRTHQIAIVTLQIASAMFAWQIKEWRETPVTVAIFLALGAAATIGGVLRGHLVFTEWFNHPLLARERMRTSSAIRLLDLITAVLLLADAALVASVGALPAVFALSAAIGIALASVVLEPATTAATFGEDR
jgi:predicted Ser/Thr protein kinase